MSAFDTVTLPDPVPTGESSLEHILATRRSDRSFAMTPLTLQQVGQLLWACQGVTSEDGKRTAPSAFGLFSLSIYVAPRIVTSLDQGLYRYIPAQHQLEGVGSDKDMYRFIAEVLVEGSTYDSAADFLLTGSLPPLKEKKGDFALPELCLEAGHAAQNVLLQATSLGLASVPIGAIHAEQAKEFIAEGLDAVYAVQVGHPAGISSDRP
ncbi:SagB/ThcOx family dehydrogenase [bacterium]|nr:SagB/ThcOx family dehydrogenase [bacterium]